MQRDLIALGIDKAGGVTIVAFRNLHFRSGDAPAGLLDAVENGQQIRTAIQEHDGAEMLVTKKIAAIAARLRFPFECGKRRTPPPSGAKGPGDDTRRQT